MASPAVAAPQGEVQDEVAWHASVHDQSQLELSFDYTVRRSEDAGEPHTFAVDLFIVTPPTLLVGSETYPKSQFYGDLTNYVRLHTPDLVDFRAGRVPSLERYLGLGLALAAKKQLSGRVVQDVRLFANYVNLRLKRLFRGGGSFAPDELHDVDRLVMAFRERYVPSANATSLLVDDEIRQVILYVDEYVSTRLHGALTQAEMSAPGQVRPALEREDRYRRERLGVAISGRSEQLALERYYHRHGSLKKFVSETLYLSRRVVKRDRIYRNAIAAAGAGLAATFAQLAQYHTTMSEGADDFGLRFATLLCLGVIAYIFKDRIKEVTKEYFARKMASRLPDHEVHLAWEHFDVAGVRREIPVARYRELVRYTDLDSLDPDVRFVADQFREPLSARHGAAVIHYERRLQVEPQALTELELGALSLKDILRFSTNAFLEHLDDPTKDVKAFDSEDGCVVLRAPKVYYLDLLVRYASQSGEGPRTVRIEALRLVLDKQGIVRLDRPVAEGRFWYEDDQVASA